MERVPEVMTPEQVADYLQLNRETIYRYIKQGKLIASRFGREYRIARRHVDLLLWSGSTRPDITPRVYSDAEIAQFLADDQLDEETAAVAARFERVVAIPAT